MEELTGVVRSTETKQSEVTPGEVEKWPNSLSQLERRGDSACLDGHTRPALGQQRVRAADKWCWTLTSGPSAILNFQ
jgi:hypothetical protein